jgi:hypothetical protein
MKKTGKILLALLLVFGLLSANFSQVMAGIMVSSDLTDPVVTPTFTGTTVVTKVLAVYNLPGIQDVSGMTYPIGFGPSEGQFSGKGVQVSGLKSWQTAKVCFDFRYSGYKWAGGVYMWNGTKWVKMSTTVIPATEGLPTLACVSGVGNGTYALIIGNYGLPEVTPEPT